MNSELVLVLDFGGQYNQLIARRVRECNVYAEVIPYTTSLEDIKAKNPKGIIFTGGPNSVYKEDSPSYDKSIFEIGVPILGICYGSQLMAYKLGGEVATAPVSEYGKTDVEVDTSSLLFEGVSATTTTWMSHTDYIAKAPQGFKITGHTGNCPVAAMENAEKKLYAVQFHPEVMHSVEGQKMLHNFLFNVCKCTGDWKMDSFVETTIAQIREKVGDGKVLCALSGGVDSSVAAVMLAKAVGKQLTCVFVDHGLLRKNEGDEVEAVFGPDGPYDLNFIRVNAQERFYSKLAGVTEPEAKRKIIGEVTADKVRIVQDADYIYREEIAKAGVEGLGQYFAALTNMRSVGVMGDERTYDYAVALRAVCTADFMTADCAQIPWDVLSTVANRIVNEVKGVNRVLYDCTSKPPATIEFE